MLSYQSGRDLLNLFFEEKDGVSTCECTGYRFRATDSLEDYAGQPFPTGSENGLYRIHQLEALPEIPEGHRVLLFDKEGSVLFDSLMKDEFKPLDEGYISLI